MNQLGFNVELKGWKEYFTMCVFTPNLVHNDDGNRMYWSILQTKMFWK